MSRIGKLPIKVPKNVSIKLEDNHIEVKGPNGSLNQAIPKEIGIDLVEDIINVYKTEDTRLARQKHGLIRSLVNNMIIGTSTKFEKKLQMIGVGYRAQVQSKQLTLNVGYSHPVLFDIPEGMEIVVEANTNLTIKGIDKEQVGLLASKIRATRPPEPYKGKGIKYNDEVILRKAGKSGK
jgi:large subunit ribosomal protein L6|tara:strand:+ start:8907 stop:9443 length:537 start_codon:yes stop_codon:yes gene_type:complete